MNCTDQNIIVLIKKQEIRADNLAIECLKKCQPQILGVLIRMGLNEADERISFLYHAITEFFLQVRKGNFVLSDKAKICTYITTIAKYKWLAFLNKKPIFQLLDKEVSEKIHEQREEKEESNTALVSNVIDLLSASDQDILIAFYFYNTPLDEYALNKKISYDSAKQRLSRARKRFKESYKIIQ